ncbi:MAG: hypothetical protein JNK41_14080 [Saprospiraceae bacterium]|nr:hypothetical protein [Saprospiraceae bacterium]
MRGHTIYIRSLACLLMVFISIGGLTAQITGKVFRDYNSDGIQQAGEPGRGGIIVNFYKDGVSPTTDVFLGSTTSSASGSYSYTPASYPVRIEFIIPSGLCNLSPTQDFSAPNGNTYGSSIQFASGPSVHNYIINYPSDFSTDANPSTFLNVYGNGDPLDGSGNVKDLPGVVKFKYKNSGHATNSGRGSTDGEAWDMVAKQSQVGATWGMAFSRQAKKIWVAATVRRHSGMGPLGTGGIYWMNADGPYDLNANLKFVDFDADFGIATSDEVNPYTKALTGNCSNEVFFSPVLGTNDDRLLPGDKTQASADPAAWDQVGKLAFGDIDISEDGRYLYVVNLYDRKLYEIDLQDPFNPKIPTAAQIKSYVIPSPCGGDGTPTGQHRPFGLKVKRGKIYVGVVCSSQNLDGTPTQVNGNSMTGNIMELDQVSGIFNPTPIVTWNFSYRNSDKPWLPWRRKWWVDGYEVNGSPMISDIEFDAEGNFLIGITDRHASQAGHVNADLCGTCCGDNLAMVGELLQAKRNTGVNTCQYTIQLSPEYYQDNYIHTESTMGGLSVHFTSDFDGALTTFMDPIDIYSSGVMLYDNKTGARVTTKNKNNANEEGYEVIYASSNNLGLFGKANSLGDLETFEIVPPIEIGNYVWRDLDHDGVQDANESPIPNVIVQLLDASNNVIASTTTNAQGGYYFNYTNVVDTIGPLKPNTLGPQPYTVYKLRISPTQFSAGKGTGILTNYELTYSDVQGVGGSDQSDNDASLVGGVPYITLTTKGPGENDHSFDFGLYFNPCDISLITATAGPCKPVVSKFDLSGDITFTYPPTTGTLTVTSGGVSEVFNAPFVSPISYLLQDIDADGLAKTVTATFSNPDQPCSKSKNYISPGPCFCELSVTSTQPTDCHNAGTFSPTDDFISFTLLGTSTGGGTTYKVTVSQGTVTPTTALYGVPTVFTLNAGSVGAGDVTVTLTDFNIPTCKAQIVIIDPLVCDNGDLCLLDDTGFSNLSCNDNGTKGTQIDDYTTFSLNPTGLGIGSIYTVTIISGGGIVTPATALYGSATSFRFNNGSATGGKKTIRIQDVDKPFCYIDVEVLNPGPCSNCVNPPCQTIGVVKN